MYALSPTFLAVLVVAGCLQTGQSTFAGEAPSEPRGVTCSTLGIAVGYGGGTSVLDIVPAGIEVLDLGPQAAIELVSSCLKLLLVDGFGCLLLLR